MTKESTLTIYSLLNSDFWTQRNCHSCHQFFTLSDYQTQNYQLYFTEILKINQLHLEVVIQLSHKLCGSNRTSYLQNTYQNQLKTNVQKV